MTKKDVSSNKDNYFNFYAPYVIRYAHNLEKSEDQLKYLAEAMEEYERKQSPLLYIENGIQKDQFADTIRNEMKIIENKKLTKE